MGASKATTALLLSHLCARRDASFIPSTSFNLFSLVLRSGQLIYITGMCCLQLNLVLLHISKCRDGTLSCFPSSSSRSWSKTLLIFVSASQLHAGLDVQSRNVRLGLWSYWDFMCEGSIPGSGGILSLTPSFSLVRSLWGHLTSSSILSVFQHQSKRKQERACPFLNNNKFHTVPHFSTRRVSVKG